MPDQKLCSLFRVSDQMAHQCFWALEVALCWFGNSDGDPDPGSRQKAGQGGNPDYLHDVVNADRMSSTAMVDCLCSRSARAPPRGVRSMNGRTARAEAMP